MALIQAVMAAHMSYGEGEVRAKPAIWHTWGVLVIMIHAA
jgi:hypothetical protein